MKWIEQQRANFILARLASGSLVRKDLMDQFDMSIATASAVFTWFQKEFPDAMRYDTNRKMYVASHKFLDHYQAAVHTPE